MGGYAHPLCGRSRRLQGGKLAISDERYTAETRLLMISDYLNRFLNRTNVQITSGAQAMFILNVDNFLS